MAEWRVCEVVTSAVVECVVIVVSVMASDVVCVVVWWATSAPPRTRCQRSLRGDGGSLGGGGTGIHGSLNQRLAAK